MWRPNWECSYTEVRLRLPVVCRSRVPAPVVVIEPTFVKYEDLYSDPIVNFNLTNVGLIDGTGSSPPSSSRLSPVCTRHAPLCMLNLSNVGFTNGEERKGRILHNEGYMHLLSQPG